MADRSVVRLLVVPPRMSAYRGEEALLAAATPHGEHSAASILETVVEAEEVDPFDHWHDEGGSWWGSDQVAPSFRTRACRPSSARAGDRSRTRDISLTRRTLYQLSYTGLAPAYRSAATC